MLTEGKKRKKKKELDRQRVDAACLCFVVGWPDGKYKTFDTESGQDIESGQPSSGAPDEDESSAPELPHLSPADSSHPSHEDIRLLSNDLAEEAAALESVEEMEEEDDSEDDEG